MGRAIINKYENGTIENIPLRTIERMAEIFGVCPQEVVGWNNSDTELSLEVWLAGGIKSRYGQMALDMFELFQSVDKVGQRKILRYAMDMAKSHPTQNNE